MSTLTIKSNHHERPVLTADELPEGVLQAEFDYMFDALGNVSDDGSYRFFQYRGSWYDVQEFTVAPDNFKALGWDGVQPESFFSAVLVQWFDVDGEYRYDSIVVGYAHW